MPLRVPQVGLVWPRSIRERVPVVMSASWARPSWGDAALLAKLADRSPGAAEAVRAHPDGLRKLSPRL